MNRLPTKQIYLLSVIIVGIIALSVYSTYALFTFEGTTSDIVTIHTPKSLKISENVYEYQQIVLEPHSVTSTDIDIYNEFDYEVCYSIWYKIIGTNDIQNKVQIFEKTENNLSSSGTLSTKTNLTVTIIMVNDNDDKVKVNIGTIGASQDEDSSCSLNLSSDKSVIVSSYQSANPLITTILENIEEPVDIEEHYLTYEGEMSPITFDNDDKIYISNEFTYKEEAFTLTEPVNITLEEFVKEYKLTINNTYFCLNNDTCKILYKINEIKIEDAKISITNYNKLIGYSKGKNGLRNVNEKDYIYYGDNPNNFIYYNCENDDSTSCELWRIVGFYYDEESKEYRIKIVRNNSIGKYQFDYKFIDNKNESTNNWNDSTLNKYLNEEYKLINDYDIYTTEHIQLVERIPKLEIELKNIKIPEEKISSKIGLLNLSDYLHTSSCEKNKINEYTKDCFTNNWLNNIEIKKEWTLTSKEVVELPVINEENTLTEDNQNEQLSTDENNNIEEEKVVDNYVINYVYSIGENITENDVNESLDVRPVVFLKERMLLIGGEGTFKNPYRVK